MLCFSDVLRKTLPCDVFGDVLEKVKHLTNDAFNDVSCPALHPDPWDQRPRRPWSPHPQTNVCWYIRTSCSFIWARQSVPFPLSLSIPFRLFWLTFPAPFATSDDRWSLTFYNRRNCCRWSPIFFLPFWWPVGSLTHSFFQRYSQIRQPILVTNIHKICLQALFFKNTGLCKNFDIVIS